MTDAATPTTASPAPVPGTGVDAGVPAAVPPADQTQGLVAPTVAPPAPAPVPAAPVIDYTQLAEALKAANAVPDTTAPAAPPAPKDPVPNNLFQKGSIVVHEWDDPYDGLSQRYGIVVATYPDEGTGAASAIAWFDGPSGPIGDQYLTAV